MIGRISTLPLIATGRSTMLCMPRIALCGGLMIGVLSMLPNTPPLVMVKVPPVISSILSFASRALIANRLISASISARLILSAFRMIGTINPLGELTAMPMSA